MGDDSQKELDRLADRFTERPEARRARIARKQVTHREAFIILAALTPMGEPCIDCGAMCPDPDAGCQACFDRDFPVHDDADRSYGPQAKFFRKDAPPCSE